jgi:hypothetical protein
MCPRCLRQWGTLVQATCRCDVNIHSINRVALAVIAITARLQRTPQSDSTSASASHTNLACLHPGPGHSGQNARLRAFRLVRTADDRCTAPVVARRHDHSPGSERSATYDTLSPYEEGGGERTKAGVSVHFRSCRSAQLCAADLSWLCGVGLLCYR